MGIEVSWRSQAGVRTDDNRDHGGIGIRGNETLCIIADGSSTAPDSGALAQSIIRELVDWYVVSDQAMTREALLALLPRLHENLSKQHRRASASYMIVHIRSDGEHRPVYIPGSTKQSISQGSTGGVPIAATAHLTFLNEESGTTLIPPRFVSP